MKILITNHHMLEYSGSEIFTLTLSEHLKKKNHEVIIYSRYIDKMKNFDALQIPLINNLEKVRDRYFDVAHVHHNINALEVRYNFPNIPIIYLSHGVLPFLEQPPILDLGIKKYLAVSEEVKQNLLKKDIRKQQISIFRNIVDKNKFYPLKKINDKPKNALILSNKIDAKKEKIIIEACNKLKIEYKFVGIRHGVIKQEHLNKYLNDADIVFSLGRGAIEAMFCARIPLIFDYLGGDGMVTPENIFEIMKHNFSGRRYKINFGVDDLIEEIEKYNKDNGDILYEIALNTFSAEHKVNEIIQYYEHVVNNNINKNDIDNEMLEVFIKTIEETRSYATNYTNRIFGTTKKGKKNGLKDLKNIIDRHITWRFK